MNRRLVELLNERRQALERQYGIRSKITGIATRRLGWRVSLPGFDSNFLEQALRRGDGQSHLANVRDWLQAADADVLFEATSLNPETGQPAIDHIRAALEHGTHAITANKGPMVHAYEELSRLAARQRTGFFFESTVMDGAPIFSMFRDNLPLLGVHGFRGILNSTTNLMLTEMESGLSFGQALAKAQELGVAETDPTNDIEAWDAAVKIAVLARVIMKLGIAVDEIERQGIGGLSGEMVREARAAGTPYKLVCRAARNHDALEASVRPEKVPLADPLAHVGGTSSIVCFDTDMFPGIAISEINPGLNATAYGMLADFVRAVGNNSLPP